MNSTKIKIHKIIPSAFKGTKQKEYDKERKRLSLSLLPSEINQIKKASVKARKKPAVLVKDVILSQIKQENFLSEDIEKKLSEACLLLRKIGANINQISKRINIDQKAEKEDFQQALSFIRKLENEMIFKVIRS